MKAYNRDVERVYIIRVITKSKKVSKTVKDNTDTGYIIKISV